MDFTKIKNVCSSKYTIKKIKTQSQKVFILYHASIDGFLKLFYLFNHN